ncbi:MAG TPA: phospholipase D-like domain-containing protein [Acidimicrobiales bacterium]|nr:phospholipase D-like domain-containing protein [Acidimicrobiales bacterium]
MAAPPPSSPVPSSPDPPAGQYRRALECLLGVAATDGNQVDVLRNGDEAFPAMLDAIGASTSTIDLSTFGPWGGTIGDEFAGAVAERSRAGVRCRILLDALGSGNMDRAQIARMAEAGADVARFRPLTNWRVTQSSHRGHRRVLVCDGEVGFMGGIGPHDRWRGDARDGTHWRDTHLRVQGPAVNGLRAAFVDNWAETGRPLFDEAVDRLPVQPTGGRSPVQVVCGNAETGWGDVATLVRSLIGLARSRLRICADYFVPDAEATQLLKVAVERGVAVQLLRPGSHAGSRTSQLASRAQYGELLEAGVRIWGFQGSMLNAKVITVDGEVGAVGPFEFKSHSLTFDDVVGVVVFDLDVVGVLDRHFDDDLARSEEISRDRWSERDRVQKLTERPLGFLARRL